MVFVYNFILLCYRFAVRLSSPFNPKAKQICDGQKNVYAEINQLQQKHTIWIHCASVGEFEQGLPLIKTLKNQYKNHSFLITFFSPSGYNYAKKKYPNETILYLPFDTANNASFFIEKIKPQAAFFIKYEFWFNYLSTLKKYQIPTFLISGIFRKDQAFFTWYGSLHRSMLTCFTHFFLQNEESAKLLSSIGFSNYTIFGDTRMDRVHETKATFFEDSIIKNFVGDSPVFIAGSVWQLEEEVLLEFIKQLPADWKIILAPHEVNHFKTNFISEHVETYINFKQQNSRILLVNTVGLLSKIYRYAQLVYVGGGFGKGIHNILEPAVYEVPVVIGPNYLKFAEAVELVQTEGCFVIEKTKDVKPLLKKLLNDTNFYQHSTNAIFTYLSRHSNVSEKIVVFISESNWID